MSQFAVYTVSYTSSVLALMKRPTYKYAQISTSEPFFSQNKAEKQDSNNAVMRRLYS